MDEPIEPGGFKAREKETYASAIAKKLINLGYEASKDGIGEYYEESVFDFWNDIPSIEKQRKIPQAMVGKTLYPGIVLEEGDTYMSVFERILRSCPTSEDRKDPRHRVRVFAVKQLAIDLYDELEILRGRHRSSRTSRKTIEDEFKDWAPST
ncbi:MAG: hypothetical protein QXU73_07580 [Thermoplasmata archaeon]